MNETLNWLLGLVSSVDPILRTLFAGIGVMLETSVMIGLIFPGDSVVLVASTGIQNVAEWAFLILAVVGGSLAGETFGFWLGRIFGPKIRTSKLGRRLGENNWERAENFLDRRGGIAVFVSRFLPVFHSLIPLTVGMSTMSYRRFLKWTIPACVLWATGYASVGWLATGTYRRLSESLQHSAFIFVGIILLFLVLVWLSKLLLSKRYERHMITPGDGDVDTLDD